MCCDGPKPLFYHFGDFGFLGDKSYINMNSLIFCNEVGEYRSPIHVTTAVDFAEGCLHRPSFVKGQAATVCAKTMAAQGACAFCEIGKENLDGVL